MELWHIRAEIAVQPEDFEGSTLGFMNVITWGDSDKTACAKLASYLQTFRWTMLGVESACPVDELIECGVELEDMIDRARNNPNAIILGTFHSYKLN